MKEGDESNESETIENGNNITAGDVPDLSREGNNGKASRTRYRPDRRNAPRLRGCSKRRPEGPLDWARAFSTPTNRMLHMDQRGFVLQVLHPNTVRVLQVFEAFELSLSMTLESFEAAGIKVEIDGFAHMTQLRAT